MTTGDESEDDREEATEEEIEEAIEEQAEAAASAAAKEVALIDWFRELSAFTGTRLPGYGEEQDREKGDPKRHLVPAAVRHAEDEAVISAYQAISRIVDRLAPFGLPPFSLDVSKIGRG